MKWGVRKDRENSAFERANKLTDDEVELNKMTNKDLQELVNRLNLENQLVTKTRMNMIGAGIVTGILAQLGTKIIQESANSIYSLSKNAITILLSKLSS